MNGFLITWGVAATLALASGAAGFYAGTEMAAARQLRALQALQAQQARAVDAANARADRAAADLEAWKARRAPRLAAATQVLADELRATPDWAGTAVPERVRSALAAGIAEAVATAGEPAPALPGLERPPAPAQ